jgi:hypothetical protein
MSSPGCVSPSGLLVQACGGGNNLPDSAPLEREHVRRSDQQGRLCRLLFAFQAVAPGQTTGSVAERNSRAVRRPVKSTSASGHRWANALAQARAHV